MCYLNKIINLSPSFWVRLKFFNDRFYIYMYIYIYIYIVKGTASIYIYVYIFTRCPLA